MAAALAIASLAFVLVVAAALLYATVTRRSRWRAETDPWDRWLPDDDEDPGTGVREPRRPHPSAGGAAAGADPRDRAA